MKTKWIVFFLTMTAVIFCLFSCVEASRSQNTQDKLNDISNVTSDKKQYIESTINSVDNQKITADQIGNAYGYHDGLMFVEKKDSLNDTTLYCIDKLGKIIFYLPEIQGKKYHVELYAEKYAFSDDFAVLEVDNTTVLCDKKGNIIRPEDIGATSFLMTQNWHGEMFGDGYILARKTTTTFDGSVDELALFNTKIEKILDFSSSFAAAYDSHAKRGDYISFFNDTEYYNGYLYNLATDRYVDLKKGETKQGASGLFTTSKIDTTSYTDVLNQYKDTLYKVHPFSNSTAGVMFKVETTQAPSKFFFTIMNAMGSFLFEPIEITVDAWLGYELVHENGVCVIDTSIGKNGYERSLIVFDANGKVAELSYHAESLLIELALSDGVIVQKITSFKSDDLVNIYTTELEPLF